MKKLFFFKEYPIYGDVKIKTTHLVPTIEVDFDDIESGLPAGSAILYETIRQVIVGDKFIVYGEYTGLQSTLKEATMKEPLPLKEILGDEEILPSVN